MSKKHTTTVIGEATDRHGFKRPLLGGHWIWKDPSRYMPHQGSQECARRVRQMEKQS